MTQQFIADLAKHYSECINIRKDVHLPMLSLRSRHIKLNKVVKGEVITAKELLPDDCNSYLFG